MNLDNVLQVIELTPIDIEAFKKFQQYHDQFTTLLTAGVFDDYNGHKSIHKDGKTIRMIEHYAVQRFK